MSNAENDEKSSPIKTINIGARAFDIAGLSAADPYFAAIGDGFEPEFERLCEDLVRYDYVCADIGANIGMKTLMLAQYVPHGRVLAIEPGPSVVSLLKRNVIRSGFRNATVISSAIGDGDGTTYFIENSASGHISRAGLEVPVRKLSTIVAEFNLQRLDFVKIDVEGYEFPILRSSIELLDYHQSLILLEFNAWTQLALAQVNPREFAEWIFSHFSHIFRIRRGGGDCYLERLPSDGALLFLHSNLVYDNVVSDLLVTNFEGRLMSTPVRLRDTARIERDAAIAARDAALTERDAAIAARDAAMAASDAASTERDAAIVALDAALAELNALHQSTSWRSTAPLRAVSSLIRTTSTNIRSSRNRVDISS